MKLERGKGPRVLAFLDVGSTSLLTLSLSLAAARTLEVNAFGIYGVGVTLATIALSLVQGGLIDYQLTRTGDTSSTAFWGIEKWFPLVLGVGVTLAVGASILPRDALGPMAIGAMQIVVGSAIVYLYARMYWVRAFLVKASCESMSLGLSCTNLAIAVALTSLLLHLSVSGWLPLLWVHLASMGLTGLVSHRVLADRRSPLPVGRSWNAPYAWENFALVSAMQASSVVAAPRLGLSFNAGLRGSSTLLGPLNVLFGGARLLLLPRMAKSSRPRTLMTWSATLLAVTGLCWSAVLYWVLAIAGPMVLGDSWSVAKEMLPWVGAMYVTQGAYLSAFIYARAVGLDSLVRSARSVQLGCILAATVVAMIVTNWRVYVSGNAIANIVAFLIIFCADPRRLAPRAT